VTQNPKRIVAAGYDAMADRFAAWQKGVRGSTRAKRVAELLELLPDRPDVLELGCGAGVASTRLLAERGRLVGVDISAEQLRRARERIPQAEFLEADLATVEFADGSFDAVVSFYVFNHVPRADVRPLLERIARWLRPGGFLLATFAAPSVDDGEPWVGEWLGVEMFFDGERAEAVLGHVRAAGLEVERGEVETMLEPDHGEASFLWVLARCPMG
jgi:cyclopropane fatty-acyl-phospholipid synthase-like methyltransferase